MEEGLLRRLRPVQEKAYYSAKGWKRCGWYCRAKSHTGAIAGKYEI